MPSNNNPQSTHNSGSEFIKAVGASAAAAALAFITIIGLFDVPGLAALADAAIFGAAFAMLRHANAGRAIKATISIVALGVGIAVLIVSTNSRDDVTTGPTVAEVPPVAFATAKPQAGVAPLRVVFDGRQSRDPDKTGILQFEWDLDGDGDFDDATTPETAHVYETPGEFRARLRVGSGPDSSMSNPVPISVNRKTPAKSGTPKSTLRFYDVPESETVLGLTVAAGETTLHGEANEDVLSRLVARTERGTPCRWKNAATGDLFVLDDGKRRYKIDAQRIGSSVSFNYDAQMLVTRQDSSSRSVETTCERF